MTTTAISSTLQIQQSTTIHDLCPKSWNTIITNDNYVIYDWNHTLIARLLPKQQSRKVIALWYESKFRHIHLIGWPLTVLWFISLFELIPSEISLASICIISFLSFVHVFCEVDLNLLRKILLFNFSAVSTAVLSCVGGCMFGFILKWDFRGWSGFIAFIFPMIWALTSACIPEPMRKKSSINTHVGALLTFIILAICLNLGVLPHQAEPSDVTFVSITNGRFPMSVDAYTIFNQAVTTVCVLEMNQIPQAWNNRIMFARISLPGKDKISEDVPDWVHIAKITV
jgi:hypothetical protein